jgi:hypothetical protein
MLTNLLKFSTIKLAFFTIAIGLYLIGTSTVAKADTVAYFQDNNGEFGTIDLNTGQTTIINSNNTLLAGYGLGVVNGKLYFTTSNNSNVYGHGQLWSINPATGAATFIGASGLDYAAFGSTTNGLFSYVIGGPIASINPANGVATEIGLPEGVNFPILSTSNDSSSLYEINAGTGALSRFFASINTATGSATTLGTSLSSNDWAAMVYLNGTLYAILQAGTPNAPFATYTINTSTGITTQYGPVLSSSQPFILGLAPYPLPGTPSTLSKIGVFSNGSWYFDMNGNGQWDGSSVDKVIPNFGAGLPNAIPVVGDWDGTGIKRVGVFSNGTWYLDMNGNGAWDGSSVDKVIPNFGAGLPNAIPVVGNWPGSTGAGDKIGVFSNGTWYLDMNGNGAWDGSSVDTVIPNFGAGLAGAMPVVGDWDGTGVTRIGVFWNGQWFLDKAGDGIWHGTPTDIYYPNFGVGLPGAWPVIIK